MANKKKNKKDKKKNNDEWLENELEDIEEPEDTSDNSAANDSQDADKLMKEAAKKIKKLEEDNKEWQNKYMRLHAEWDTYRRRISEQRAQDKACATEALVTDELPVLDDFERSIDYADKNGEDGLLAGVEAVYSKLTDSLQKNGVEIIDPEYGEPFDALENQAVSTVEDSEVYDESISSVLQKGYKMGTKVIRPATVVVTTGGEIRPKEEDDDEADSDE